MERLVPNHDDATNLLLALRDVGVAELSHEALENRVRSALADAIAETTRTRPRRATLRPATGRLFMALSVAIPIAIAVVAIALLSHKPRTAARSSGGLATATQQRSHKQLVRSQRLNSYEPVSANVIGRDPSLWYQSIEIDKGSQDGVALNDPVIGDGALVGKISSVNPTAAVVQLITDPTFAIAAQVQDASGDTGVLEPKIGDPSELLLRDLPNHAPVAFGQHVVTAGFTRGSLAPLYPAGIPIGQISDAQPNEKLGHGSVPVAPAADIRHVDAVQILTSPLSIPNDLQQAFRAFRRPASPADALPAAVRAELSRAERSWINPRLARRVGGTQTPAFVVSANSSLCLVLAPGFSCISQAGAISGRLLTESFNVSRRKYPEVVTGLVPDGVRSVAFTLVGGGSKTVLVHDNVYQAHLTRRATTMSFTSSSGLVSVHL